MFEIICMAAIFGILLACVCTIMCKDVNEEIEANWDVLEEKF